MVSIVQPGQTLTADRLNSGFLVGMLIFRATRDTAQSISTNTNPVTSNALSWETIELDDLAGWSASNPTRYTCKRAGWYELGGDISVEGSTGGTVRGAAWLINGTLAQAGHGTRVTATPTNVVTVLAARALCVPLAVGDYVELVPVQNSGTALNTGTGGGRPSMNATYKRPV